MWGGMTYKGAHHSSRNVMTGTANDCESLLQPNKNNSAEILFLYPFCSSFYSTRGIINDNNPFNHFLSCCCCCCFVGGAFFSLAEQTKRMCAY
jgi:hypothetical protein